MRWLAMVAVVMVAVAGAVRGWDCVCNPSECEGLEPSGCPGQGYVVWDPCRCCKVCARTLGEDCGEFKGTCEPKLQCIEGTCTT
uniref:Neuroparsin n=1 Tax=Grapholita molesta TaxID=192188 RepID=A0A7D7KHW8_GRAMO|nr:neuroparsin [Grapholita molesta]